MRMEIVQAKGLVNEEVASMTGISHLNMRLGFKEMRRITRQRHNQRPSLQSCAYALQRSHSTPKQHMYMYVTARFKIRPALKPDARFSFQASRPALIPICEANPIALTGFKTSVYIKMGYVSTNI